jgi:AcrR family transcriptional regulator
MKKTYDNKRTKTKDLLSQAGVELMLTKGANLTMDEIARAAGVSRGTLYNHFKTKSDLIRHHIESLPERAVYQSKVFGLINSKGFRERLNKYAMLFLDFISSHRTIMTIFGNERLRSFLTADENMDFGPMEDVFHWLIKLGKEDGEIRPDLSNDELVFLLKSLFLPVWIGWVAGENPRLLAQRRKNFVEFFCAGAFKEGL